MALRLGKVMNPIILSSDMKDIALRLGKVMNPIILSPAMGK